MRRVALLLLLLFTFACSRPQAETPPTDDASGRPNVLIVVTDDERFESNAATPQLYDWFRDGAIFRRGYATTPHCCPSRASIFSGRYVHNHRVEHQSRIKDFDHTKTMQHELREAGYSTGFVGKFLNGWDQRKAPPHFDRWTLGEGYHDARFNADGHLVRPPYGPTWVFQRGRKYIDDWEANDDKPWALMVSTFAPHDPYGAEEEYANEMFPWNGSPATKETDRSDKPPYVRRQNYSEGLGIETRQSQFRVLRSVDDAFMKTISHLEEQDELDNTLVIYLSDNGYLWGEHGLIAKGVPYDGATRVPIYARGPGIDQQTSDNLVANIDVAPTVYEAAGIDPAYEVDGRPLQSSDRDQLLLEYAGGRDTPRWATLVTENSTYTEYADGFREYYDLDVDRYQLVNMPDLATQQMVDDLAKLRACKGETCP